MEAKENAKNAAKPAAKKAKVSGTNPMQKLSVDKLVVNIGTGSDEKVQSSARNLLQIITNRKPSDAVSRKRNPSFKISKGFKIGTFVTLRGKEIKPLATKLFDAIDNKIKDSSVSENSVSFGIREYIDISGIKYDPKIGMLGMNVNLSFRRPGTRVSLRKRKRNTVGLKHRIVTKDEIKNYLKNEFNVEIVSQ